MLNSLWRRTLIHQIDDAHIRYARICFKTNLAGSTIGIAHLYMVSLNLRTELTKTVFVQFREGETSVTSEAATTHTLRQEDVRRAFLGEVDEIVGHAHLSRRASQMQGDRLVNGMEIKSVYKVCHNELCRLVKLHFLHHLTHTVQTRTLGAEHGVFALFGGLP